MRIEGKRRKERRLFLFLRLESGNPRADRRVRKEQGRERRGLPERGLFDLPRYHL